MDCLLCALTFRVNRKRPLGKRDPDVGIRQPGEDQPTLFASRVKIHRPARMLFRQRVLTRVHGGDGFPDRLSACFRTAGHLGNPGQQGMIRDKPGGAEIGPGQSVYRSPVIVPPGK